MKTTFSVLLTLVLFLGTFNLAAQEEESLINKRVFVKMYGGREYNGMLLEENQSTILLRTVHGDFNILWEEIKLIRAIEYDGPYSFANQHYTRYYLAPSAIPLEKGRAQFNNFWITTNAINYGLTKNITVGAGLEFVTLFSEDAPIWFVDTKIGGRLADNFYLAGGLIHYRDPFQDAITLGYVVSTFGSPESNVSIGVGYNFSEDYTYEFVEDEGLITTLSGTTRVTNRISFLSESDFNFDLVSIGTIQHYSGTHGLMIQLDRHSIRTGIIVNWQSSSGVELYPYLGYGLVF